MSERDEYIPTMSISNTVPARLCNDCGRELYGVFYWHTVHVKGTRAEVRNVCERCRP